MTKEIMDAISNVSGEVWGVWFLIGAALVFWMQELVLHMVGPKA